MARNALSETQKKLDDLKRKRAAALAEIEKKKADAQNELTTAQEEIEEATGKMDLTAYEKASARKQKAQIALDMYSRRCEQIKKQECITVQESEETLNGLLKYERQLEKAFATDARDAIANLLEAIKKYHSDVRDIQIVYKEWVHTIHARHPDATYHPEDYSGHPYVTQLQNALGVLLGQLELHLKDFT